MEDYQATPFSGEWDEDPKIFLGWFSQCVGAADDKTKARKFVYYLRASSDADEWFEDLPEEEKGSWEKIERLFRQRWLKEEEKVNVTKEPVTIENEQQPESTASHSTFHLNNVSNGVPQPPSHLEIGPSVHVATSQSPALSENGKNSKIGTTRAGTSEISQDFTVLSLATLSTAASDLSAPSTSTTALETRSTTAGFTQKSEKGEKPSISTPNPPKQLSPSIVGPTNDVTRAHMTPLTPNDVAFRLPTFPTTASSSVPSQSPPSSRLEKSALLRSVFDSQASMELTASTTIVTASKTRSESSDFMENHQKVENSSIFTQKDPKSLVSSHSRWTDNICLLLLSTTVIPALETRSTTTYFMKIHQELENSPISTKTAPESLVSGCFFTYFLPTPSIAPTKHPCNSSGLLVMLFLIVISQCFRLIFKFSH